MDRNDKIKQKYYEKKPSNNKVIYTGNFDPSPYVDIIFEKMGEAAEDEDVEPNDFMSNLMENPKLAIIFGKGSALNMAQKALVLAHLNDRIRIAKTFNPQPYVDKLMEIYDTDEFDEFEKQDNDGDTIFDFEEYFKAENFTKEQLALIEIGFYKRQSGNATTLSKKFRPLFFISVLFIIIPPFFIPNLLHRFGWISADAGWFTKISIGIVSLVILFLVLRQLFGLYADKVIRAENLLLVGD